MESLVRTTRRFVYYVATSLDGYIARPDGRVDWLEERPAADYGFQEFLGRIDTIVWGRKTYEQSQALGGLDAFGPSCRHIVVSRRSAPEKADPRVAFTRGPITEVADKLRAEDGKDVWIMGGAELAAGFAQAGQIDEIVVHVIPVVLGQGIPLFRPEPGELRLALEDSHAFSDGVVRLHYRIDRSPPEP